MSLLKLVFKIVQEDDIPIKKKLESKIKAETNKKRKEKVFNFLKWELMKHLPQKSSCPVSWNALTISEFLEAFLG